MKRITGHALQREGAPFLLNERGEWNYAGRYGGTSGTGVVRMRRGVRHPRQLHQAATLAPRLAQAARSE